MPGRITLICAMVSICTVVRADFPVSRELAGEMYQTELNAPAGEIDRLFAAHQLIEEFFAAKTQKDRAQITQSLVDTKIDANTLGRLARLRLGWPDLKPGVTYVNEHLGQYPVRYFLGIPTGYDRRKSSPLVIKLPTPRAFVTDPPPTGDEVAQIYEGWINAEMKLHGDAIVLMPLLDLDHLWGPSYEGMNSVIQSMHHAAGVANIDPARVYLVGHSMAAAATWNLALHYPTYFAAVLPMAGVASADWQRLRLMNLRNTMPVVWHDQDDPVVKVKASESLVTVLRRMKIDVIYEETKGLGHVPTTDLYDRLYQQMRARSRAPWPQQVSLQSNRPDTIFNRIDWLQVYQPIRAGKEQRLIMRRTGQIMLTNEIAHKIDAAFTKPNQIEIASENVGSMRIYVNEQMIDFKRAVTVIVNKRPRFEGFVTPSVEEMLKDQMFLGRGWRYFTGVIDIDLGPKPATRSTTKPTPQQGR